MLLVLTYSLYAGVPGLQGVDTLDAGHLLDPLPHRPAPSFARAMAIATDSHLCGRPPLFPNRDTSPKL
jgi:hypothetical protein